MVGGDSISAYFPARSSRQNISDKTAKQKFRLFVPLQTLKCPI
jgi:hypothetical protein